MKIKKKIYFKNYYLRKTLDNIVFNNHSLETILEIINNKYYYYNTFFIKKKSGNYREINQSLKQLFLIQQDLSSYLLFKRKAHKSSHAFEIEKSILTNASKHINKNIVLNIDLENFFNYITKEKVVETLKENFNIDEKTIDIISELCTYNNKLPQGAPSSPILSNYCCSKLDQDLNSFCKLYGIIYSRYADDLTFSFNYKKLPIKQVNDIYKIIIENGFVINTKKIRYAFKNQRQLVTGLVVNNKVNVKKDFIRLIRSILYNWENKGFDYIQSEFKNKISNSKNIISTMDGWINFLGSIRGKDDAKFMALDSKFKELAFVHKAFYNHLSLNHPITINDIKNKLKIDKLPLYKLESTSENYTLEYTNTSKRIKIHLQKRLAQEIAIDASKHLSISIQRDIHSNSQIILISNYEIS